MEYLAMVAALVVAVGIGVVIGIFVGVGRMGKAIEAQSVGNLRFDCSEPDEPTKPYLEVYSGITIPAIAQKKFAILKVINESYLSRD